jgi:hypothetical protein
MSEQKTGAELIAAERQRQVTEEGYTAEHDIGHVDELLQAAKCYAETARFHLRHPEAWQWQSPVPVDDDTGQRYWPWNDEEWKPGIDPVRMLEKAGALIAAAIDAVTEGARS